MIDGRPLAGVALATAAFLFPLLRSLLWAWLRVLLNSTASLRASRFWARGQLLVLAVAALSLTALFAGLTVAVLQAGGATRFDAAVSAALVPYRAPWLLHAFVWLTTLGTDAALAGVAVTATGFLWAGQRSGFILPLWVTFAGAQATTWIGKYAIGRVRPVFLEGVATAISPSLPSGHASGVAATFGFVAYAVTRDLGPRERFEVAYWTVVLIALVGFSRVFLGVHFATDVAAGFLVGAFWLLVGFALAEWTRARRFMREPPAEAR